MFSADLSWILRVSSDYIFLRETVQNRKFDIQPKTVYHIPYD